MERNILIMKDAFSNFTMDVVTTNEQTKTVAKALVYRWLYTYEIPSWIHSNWGKSFDNQIIHHLYTMYGIKQSKITHITLAVIPSVRD